MEFVAVGRCRRKKLRLYQTTRNLTSGDITSGDSTGTAALKKIRLVNLLDLFEGRGEKGQCDLVCGASLDDWADGDYADVLLMLTCGECVEE